MTANRAQDGPPVTPCIDLCAHRPPRPANCTPARTINLHNQLAKDRLIHIEHLFCLCHIIQLCNTMWCQLNVIRGIWRSSLNDGCRCELGNSYMIRMHVSSLSPPVLDTPARLQTNRVHPVSRPQDESRSPRLHTLQECHHSLMIHHLDGPVLPSISARSSWFLPSSYSNTSI